MDSDEIYTNAENAIKLKIPEDLKSMLIVNGYVDAQILADISEENLVEIENFAKNRLWDIIPKTDYGKYYGIFKLKPENYEILSGHRKIILLISKYCKGVIAPHSAQLTDSDDGSTTSGNKTRDKTQESQRRINKSTTDFSIDITEENQCILKAIKSYIKSKCSSTEEWEQYREKCEGFIIATKRDSNADVVSDVKCFCNGLIRIQKKAKNINCQSRWIYSNFHRHFATHMRNDHDIDAMPPHSMKKNPKKVKCVTESVTIKSFFKPKINSQNADPEPGCSSIKNAPKVNIISHEVFPLNSETPPEDFQVSRIINIPGATNNSCYTDTPLEKSLCLQKPLQQQSIWANVRYQRSERERRRRERKEDGQQLITNFYAVVTQVKNVIADHPELECELMQNLPVHKGINSSHQLLDLLYEISTQNENRAPNKNTFNPTIKRFALYIFYIGGRLLYETLQANLKKALPSISSLLRFANQEKKSCEEGVFDYAGLDEFLVARGQKKIVWISEDATRITGKIEFDPKGNKIVGFVLPLKNGIPIIDTFIATSANAIQEYFRIGTKAHYVYTVMAQPLSENAPSYCLTIFGTDNKFTFQDVQDRWKSMREGLQRFGIEVAGFSSDGDTRLLKAMRLSSVLPVVPVPNGCETSKTTKSASESERVDKTPEIRQLNEWKWYQIRCDDEESDNSCYVQDTVHILTKLRVRLLNSAVTLPMGNYIAGNNHLQALVRDVSKDQHLLTATDLKVEDKMNFEAAEKMCSLKVIDLLKEKIPDSKATVHYLRLMRYVIDAFLNKKTTVEKRLYYMWYCIFFLRMWKNWLKNHKYTIKNNFLSTNAYLSIELNGHSLIKFIVKARQNEVITNDMFLPWLFSSQACEKLFRTTRSLTSTFSTVVNFSVKDILNRIDRIQSINNILKDCSGTLKFPREDKKMSSNRLDFNLPDYNFRLSDKDILSVVEEALQNSIKDAKVLGITVTENCWNFVTVPVSRGKTFKQGTDPETVLEPIKNSQVAEGFDDESEEEGRDEEYNSQGIYLNDTDVIDKVNDGLEPEESDELRLDLCNITLDQVGPDLQLKDYSDKKSDLLIEKGSFVRVSVKGKSTVIRKSSLCWLLDQTEGKVSSDRLRRFIRNRPKTPKPREHLQLKSQIKTGDWCLFEYANSKTNKCVIKGCLLGRVLSFGYLEPSSKVLCPDWALVQSGEGLGCHCIWYSIDEAGILTAIDTDTKEMCDISLYKCSIPCPIIHEENKELRMKIDCGTMTELRRRFCTKKRKSEKGVIRHKPTKKIKTAKLDDTYSETSEEDEAIFLDDSTDTEVFDSNKSDDDSDCDRSVIETQVGEALTETKLATKVEVTKKTDKVSVGSFVVCTFIYNQGTKKEKQKKFIAEVINRENSNVTVSCMRYNEKTNSYSFPHVRDEMIIHMDQIDNVLNTPVVSRGKYKFLEISRNITK